MTLLLRLLVTNFLGIRGRNLLDNIMTTFLWMTGALFFLQRKLISIQSFALECSDLVITVANIVTTFLIVSGALLVVNCLEGSGI